MKKSTILLMAILWSAITFGWNAPTISSPSNNSTSIESSVTLNWNAVANSEGYILEVDTSPNFNSQEKISFQKNYISSSSANTDTYEIISQLLFNTTYYWRVKAYITNDTSNWITYQFSTLNNVALTSPANNATNIESSYTLDWDAYSGVDKYILQIDTSVNFNSSELFTDSVNYINSSNTGSDSRYTVTKLLFNTKYYWRVKAKHSKGESAWSTRIFTTLNHVDLKSPINNVSLEAVGSTLDWDAFSGVDSYYVHIDTSKKFNSPELQTAKIKYINSSNTGSDSRQFFENLRYGAKYFWRVMAMHSKDSSAWTVDSLTTKDYVKSTFVNYSTNKSTSGITIDWDAFDYSEFYDFELDTTRNFNSNMLVQNTTAYISTNNNNTDTRVITSTLLPNQIYYWRVRARNKPDTSQWNTFVFSTGSNIIPTIPTLVAPKNNDVNRKSEETLYWNAVTSATSYRIEVSISSDFSNPTVYTSTNNYVNINGLTNATTYYWRVQAINDSGSSFYSEEWNFTTEDISISINQINSTNIKVYPNPFLNRINILLDEVSQHNVFILDINGKEILSKTINGLQNAIDLSNLPKGKYIIKVSSKKEKKLFKLVKK